MGYYSDPTAARAIGAADRELRRMTRLAYRYRTEPAFASRFRDDPARIFTGLFSRLLTDPLDELREILFPKEKDGNEQ